MLELFFNSPFYQFFSKALREEASILLESLWSTPKAIVSLCALHITSHPILFIHSQDQIEPLLDDLVFFSKREALDFPSWDVMPHEDMPPNIDLIGKRFDILHELIKDHQPQLVVTTLQGFLQKLPSKKLLTSHFHEWKVKDEVSFNSLESFLSSLGYKKVPITNDKGEFSIRGGILDIFPIASTNPYRLDFFGDSIDQIRIFDPISQKSLEKKASMFLPPASELSLLKSSPTLDTLLDYFKKPPVVIFDDIDILEDRYAALKKYLDLSGHFYMDLKEAYKQPSFKNIFLLSQSFESFQDSSSERIKAPSNATLQLIKLEFFDIHITAKRLQHPFRKLSDYLSSYVETEDSSAKDLSPLEALSHLKASKPSLHFITHNDTEDLSLRKKLQEHATKLPSHTCFHQGYLTSGCVLIDTHLIFFPYTELSHRYKIRRKKWRNSYHTPASEFHELSPGDYVVHLHNGIGKFLGIDKQKNHLGDEEEFMTIEYANHSKLFVPLSQSHLVTRYIGLHEEGPTLHTLGTNKWLHTKAKAQQAITGYAKELLQRQAERKAKGGFSYPSDGEDLLLFEEEFPFVETEDQLRAIAEIKLDMSSSLAMDRLICGDVGYGKTEVAMRAAFKAILDGKKQVAVLVPTTTLAMQHFETFRDRMANFPINIKVLSRFISAKDTKKTLEALEKGSVDLIIGTHRLISGDVKFKDLGLIIIDEEQRFGVRAKEHLKKIKTDIDCLTLSATPIPRTLYMSMVGIRELSVINTPPQDRLPIKTIMAESDKHLIKNALERELHRQGQAYYIHNRVETIYHVADDLKKLLPEAKIGVAHGQMEAHHMDDMFHAFKNGSLDILVATTIVENGIDIPNANTIIIDRADQHGLADLYQLRGRVGRWNRPAYAYFLIPKNKELQDVTKKRLQALVETSGFGGGMKLALKDLEIRGAGDLLGTQQSGQVSTIGFHLYCKMLKKSIDSLKTKTPLAFFETKLEVNFPSLLPQRFIPETSIRLELYHRLGDSTSLEEVDQIFHEIQDRFGKLPPEALTLHHMTRLKVIASSFHIHLVKFEKMTLHIHRQKGQDIIKKVFKLPSSLSPKELEEFATTHIKSF